MNTEQIARLIAIQEAARAFSLEETGQTLESLPLPNMHDWEVTVRLKRFGQPYFRVAYNNGGCVSSEEYAGTRSEAMLFGLTRLPVYAWLSDKDKREYDELNRKAEAELAAGIRPYCPNRRAVPIFPKGGVYFAKIGPHIKIGVSVDIASRLKSLQTACAEPVELLRKVPGHWQEEREYHRRFHGAHVRGELFRDVGALSKFAREAA